MRGLKIHGAIPEYGGERLDKRKSVIIFLLNLLQIALLIFWFACAINREREIIYGAKSIKTKKGGVTMARELSVWKPFRELAPFDFEGMRREMDRFWDSFFERPRRRTGEGGEWYPSLDVAETKNDLVIKAEVPGMEPKDIDISLFNGILTIKGEKKQEREEKRRITTSLKEVMGLLADRFNSRERSRAIKSMPLIRMGF